MGKVTSQIMSKDMIDSKNKANVDAGALSTRVGVVETSLTDIVKLQGLTKDGIIDVTTIIQNALNDKASKGGGDVILPSGKFKITSIVIPLGVSLVGDYTFNSDRSNGTWLYCVGTTDAAITCVNQNTISQIGFYYPEQVLDGSGNPKVYPASIKIFKDANRITIRDVFFQNTYIAIDADRHHELLTIENVQGYAIYQGIIIDYMTDIDRISNVHFNCNAWDNTNNKPANVVDFFKWTRKQGTAFTVRRADWISFVSCFALGYRYGFVSEPSPSTKPNMDDVMPSSETNRVVSGLKLIDCGFDVCGCDVWIKDGWAIQLQNCFFTSYNIWEPGVANSTAAIIVDAARDITITDCRWWGTDQPCLSLAADQAIVENNQFYEYGKRGVTDSQDYRAVLLWNGMNTIRGNHFNGQSQANVFGIIINGANVMADIDGNFFKDYVRSAINTVSSANNFRIGVNIFKNVVPAGGVAKVFLGSTPSNYVYDSTKDFVIA